MMRKIWIPLYLFLMIPVAVAAGEVNAFGLKDLNIHGFISQGYMLSDENSYLADTEDGTFQFNELGINFSKNMTDRLRIGLQLFSRDQGEFGNNKVVVDWAYGDYRWQDWLGIRAGIIRQTHGFYNETRDFDMLRTSILLPQSVYNENNRDFLSRIQGISVYGEIPLKSAGSLSYTLLAGTKDIDEDGPISKRIESTGMFRVEGFDTGTFYNGSLQWNLPVEGLRIGVSATKIGDQQTELRTTVPMGTLPAGTNLTSDLTEYHNYVFSIEYTWNNLILVGECMHQKQESITGGFSEFVTRPMGYYMGGAYRFGDRFEMGAYYSVHYREEDDKDGTKLAESGQPDYRAWQKDFALSARFDISSSWSVKLEGHKINGAGQLFAEDNSDDMKENWYLFAGKVSFSF